MSTATYPVRYDRQFEKYIGQFMRAISGLQVENGVERSGSKNTRRVDVVWGGMDRVVASIMSKRNDHLVNSRLPIIGVSLSGIVPSAESRVSPYWNEPMPKRRVQSPPEKPTAINRMVGSMFIMNLDASIYASSTSELFMILEQMLAIFNPRLVIQSDTDIVNADYITSVSLESIQPEITFPLGQSAQECMMTLGFSVPVRLRYPLERDSEVLEKIKVNVMKEGDDRPIFTEIIDGQ